MPLLTARSSTIFIAAEGEATRVYHSFDDVPAELRAKLQQSTNSVNSATILIADQRGREELARALQGKPSQVRCRLAETMRARQALPQPIAGPAPSAPPATPAPSKTLRLSSLSTWFELLLPVLVGALLWFLIESRF
jgi:hypothetical protein